MSQGDTGVDVVGAAGALAEALVLCDASDLQALAGLHTLLEAIATALEETGQRAAAGVVNDAAAQVEATVLGEEEDPAALLARLGHMADVLQTVVDATDNELAAALGGGAAPAAAAAPSASAEAAADASPISADMDLLAGFVEEAEEHLQSAEASLLTIETDPEEPEAINAVFRGFHTIKGVSGFLGLTAITHLAHEAENMLDKARRKELLLEGAAIDHAFETIDALRRLIGLVGVAVSEGHAPSSLPACDDLIRHLKTITAADPSKKLGEILTEAGVVSEDDVVAAVTAQEETEERPLLGEQLVREGRADARDVALALRGQRQAAVQQAPTEASRTVLAEPVKVDAERLDRLIDLVGELVIAESMVSQSPELAAYGATRLGRDLSRLDKITRELQELGTSLRMMPVRPLFQKMTRLVRDLARKSGKKVNLTLIGEDTELDKTVIDVLGDPLVHMVRNAVDHGLEPDAATREANGKPGTGQVTLRAYHKGGSINVEISDDGRGMDRDVIYAKAVERGLIEDGATLTDREIYNLVFEPGFSTAKTVTDVSGRGVGMDVVRRSIESLRGQIEIETELGAGTLFRIRLPLTLAVIDGMVVRVAGERYILPTFCIVTTVQPTPDKLSTVVGKGELLNIQDRLLPLFRLADVFGVPGSVQDPTAALAVVVEDDGAQVCLLVDELLGQQQIVIKGLDESLRDVGGLSGAAILPDGRVGLILDVGGLMKLATSATQYTLAAA